MVSVCSCSASASSCLAAAGREASAGRTDLPRGLLQLLALLPLLLLLLSSPLGRAASGAGSRLAEGSCGETDPTLPRGTLGARSRRAINRTAWGRSASAAASAPGSALGDRFRVEEPKMFTGRIFQGGGSQLALPPPLLLDAAFEPPPRAQSSVSRRRLVCVFVFVVSLVVVSLVVVSVVVVVVVVASCCRLLACRSVGRARLKGHSLPMCMGSVTIPHSRHAHPSDLLSVPPGTNPSGADLTIQCTL